jgi:hypothetical protein
MLKEVLNLRREGSAHPRCATSRRERVGARIRLACGRIGCTRWIAARNDCTDEHETCIDQRIPLKHEVQSLNDAPARCIAVLWRCIDAGNLFNGARNMFVGAAKSFVS